MKKFLLSCFFIFSLSAASAAEMVAYAYSPKTGEFLAAIVLHENPEEPGKYIGAGPWAVDFAPPSTEQNQVAVINAGKTAWEIQPDYRGLEGYIDGLTVIIKDIGPLPPGWSIEPPAPDPSEVKAAEAYSLVQKSAMKRAAEENQFTDPELIMLGETGYFDEWASGQNYTANKRLTYEGTVYVVIQNVASLAHQPPGSAGMLAIYRPVELGHTGDIDDPIPFKLGMDVEINKYYSHEAHLYLAKMNMPACVWAPGTPGLWQWELVQ